jgi:hypothetical protein
MEVFVKQKIMTVAQLIEILQEMNQDDEVAFGYPSGDYWRTTIAKQITSVEEAATIYSEYHGANKVDEEDAEYDDDDKLVIKPGRKAVVLLK